jgi:hypothetical protein
MRDNVKAIGFGWLLYVFGNISYYVIINAYGSMPSYLNYLLYFLVFLGGFVTGKLSVKKPIMNLILAGILMGLTAGGINYLYWLLGFPADFGTFKGFQIVIAFAIPSFVLLALFGGAFGYKDESN